jgi:segregation and condensation protein A
VSAVLGHLAGEADLTFARCVGPDDRFAEVMPDLLDGVTPERLRDALAAALVPRAVPRVDLFHVAPIRVSVADAVAELLDELPRVGRITFRHLTAELVDRIEVIVRFLALLELFKQGLVELDQAERFGDIEVRWLGDEPVAVGAFRIDDYDG